MLGIATMGQLDEIQIDNELDKKVSRLALRHYGDSSEVSRLCVAEVALELYLLWLDLVEGGGNEIEEPITSWEFANKQPATQLPAEIRGLLFRRK